MHVHMMHTCHCAWHAAMFGASSVRFCQSPQARVDEQTQLPGRCQSMLLSIAPADDIVVLGGGPPAPLAQQATGS
jgi:hypothetical protein